MTVYNIPVLFVYGSVSPFYDFSVSVTFECDLATNWPKDIQEWGFQITKRNMEEL